MLVKIQNLHDSNSHLEILDEINTIPSEFWDFELTCLYARALNNCGRYAEALETLLAVRVLGEDTRLWNIRVGYSLCFLGREEEASHFIKRAIVLGEETGETDEAIELLDACSAKFSFTAEPDLGEFVNAEEMELYSGEELEAVENHIKEYFGDFTNVFHELASHLIHVDVVIIEPTKERNYYTLVTMGMGARKMRLPPELERHKLARAEIMICLPPDWKLSALEDEKWYWPLRWLKTLARLPANEDTWLGWGHTIPAGAPFAENTDLSALMLICPGAFGEGAFECRLPDGDEVNFYQAIPLYEEEVKFKLKHDAKALLEIMNDEALEYIVIDREVFVP